MALDGLTNFELFDIAKANNIKLDDVIMMDEIEQIKPKNNYNVIVNLQNSGQGGSHWICLIIRNKNWLYVDSFGGYPHLRIIKHCLKNNKNLGYSAYICQDLKAQTCGLYCLKCIQYLQTTKEKDLYSNANSYVNQYEPNRKLNEKLLYKNINI